MNIKLLTQGMGVDIQDKEGQTPLHYAIMYNQVATCFSFPLTKKGSMPAMTLCIKVYLTCQCYMKISN